MTDTDTDAVAPGPLTGVTVLDLTNVLAGPYAAYQLALMGADVIKVETPHGGDLARRLGTSAELNARHLGISFLAQNAQKRSITLDLKTEGGAQALRRLVATADVLVENFRPGVLERLGFGWEQLHTLNTRLILCQISGFGQTGPMRTKPAYDQIIQGYSGMMSVTGTQATGPLRAGFPLADTIGGLAAAFAVSSALAGRATTGVGSVIDVSMLETAVTAMGWVVSNLLVDGHEPLPLGNDNGTAAPSGAFATGDGLLNIAANKQEQFETLCALVDRADLIVDPRFAERENRKAHRAALTIELEHALAARAATEWEDLLSSAGVPAAAVLRVDQMLASPQIRDRGLVHELPFPGGGGDPLRVLGNGIRIDGRISAPRTPPPTLGEHTDEILATLGYSADDIAALHEEGAV